MTGNTQTSHSHRTVYSITIRKTKMANKGEEVTDKPVLYIHGYAGYPSDVWHDVNEMVYAGVGSVLMEVGRGRKV